MKILFRLKSDISPVFLIQYLFFIPVRLVEFTYNNIYVSVHS